MSREEELNKLEELTGKVHCVDNKIGMGWIPNFAVDLIIFSPPYFDARPEYAEYKAYYIFLRELGYIINECYRVLKSNAMCAINVGDNYKEGLDISSDVSKLMRDAGFKICEKFIWNKPVGVAHGRIGETMKKTRNYYPFWTVEFVIVGCRGNKPNYSWLDDYDLGIIGSKYKAQIWDICPDNCKVHPAVFPEELVLPLIIAYSRKGDIVLDPYSGRGTTCMVAKKYSRRYLGFDYKDEYVKFANDELSKINEIKDRSLQKSLIE